MITAVHTLIYSDDAPATRAFLRDVLGLPHVAMEGPEDGWLIFGTGPSEMGVHPTSGQGFEAPRHHEVSFMCDDVAATRSELEGKGATFQGAIEDHGWGLVAMVEVPGTDPMMLYQPRHTTAYDKS